MADEDSSNTNGNGHEENGHVPEIELIIKVRNVYKCFLEYFSFLFFITNIISKYNLSLDLLFFFKTKCLPKQVAIKLNNSNLNIFTHVLYLLKINIF